MDHTRKDHILFSLVYMQLVGIKRHFDQRKCVHTQEDAAAWIAICENLFDLACAAAVRSNVAKRSTDSLVELVEEIRDHVEWNTYKNK